MKEKTNMKKSLVFVAIFLLVVLIVGLAIWQIAKPPIVHKFEISEISSGVYAYHEVVVSRVPAQNYTIATVCNKQGNVFTIRGDVSIIYQTDTASYVVLEERNIVNSDVITIYVPPNTVQYLGTVTSR